MKTWYVYFLTVLFMGIPFDSKPASPIKIIALMQVRNEELFIEPCLRAISLYADEIIMLDDGSSDRTFEIIKKLSAQLPIEEITCHTHSSWQVRTENYNRQLLLDAGRRRGGTHFIIIDADEMFSSVCLQNNWLRNEISKMRKGQMLKMPMINLWGSVDEYRTDPFLGPYPPRFDKVPVVFCDDGVSSYLDNKINIASGVLHNLREPLNRQVEEGFERDIVVGNVRCSIVHFKSVNLENIIIKLVWYMCLELIRMNEKTDPASYAKNAKIINDYYLTREYKGLLSTHAHLMSLGPLPPEIFAGYRFLDRSVYATKLISRQQEVAQWFKKYGLNYFADLKIWDIEWVKSLQLQLKDSERRAPRENIFFGNKHAATTGVHDSSHSVSDNLNSDSIEPTRFVVVTAAYNNKEWLIQYLEALFGQQYQQWRLIYIDDCSNDGSVDLLETWFAEHQLDDRVILIKNSKRQGHMANQRAAAALCDDHEVMVIVDGDDFLARNDVFSILDKAYQEGAWLTYGQFWYWKKDKLGYARSLPEEVLKNGAIRNYPRWSVSHLRTFYVALFKKIRQEDLLYNGAYYPMCVDVATMVPMIEMAREHVHFIPEVLLTYNDSNPLSFFHEQRQQQADIEMYIRNQQPYQGIESLWQIT